MEIFKVGLTIFILFYFTWFQILEIIFFVEFFYFCVPNKNILLENSNYINVLFYYLITIYEISYYYFLIGYNKFINNYVGKYIYYYLRFVNNKYLQLKNYLKSKLINLTIKTIIKITIMLKKEKLIEILQPKYKKQQICKKTKNIDYTKFLDDLEKI